MPSLMSPERPAKLRKRCSKPRRILPPLRRVRQPPRKTRWLRRHTARVVWHSKRWAAYAARSAVRFQALAALGVACVMLVEAELWLPLESTSAAAAVTTNTHRQLARSSLPVHLVESQSL